MAQPSHRVQADRGRDGLHRRPPETRGRERGLGSLNPVSLSSRSGGNWFNSVLNRTEGSPGWRLPSKARPCEVVRGFLCAGSVAASVSRATKGAALLEGRHVHPQSTYSQQRIILGLLPLGNEIPHAYGGIQYCICRCGNQVTSGSIVELSGANLQ